jgi:hypothetical protein
LLDSLALLEFEQLVFPGFLIDGITAHSAQMGFDGSALGRVHPHEVLFFLISLGVFLDNIHLSESHFFGMEVEIFLILIDGIEKLFFSYHSVQLAFGVAEQLN